MGSRVHNEYMEVSSLPRFGGRVAARPSPRLLSRMPDERLVEHLRRGHDAAFEVIYDRHHRGILSFCRHMLASREEAEDAVQQTFISAHADLVGSDKPIRLKAWLYTIARNRCLSMLRARREHAELSDIPTAGLSDSVLERDDLRQLLADIHGLPEDQRAALVLSELGDLSHAEIAETVGCEPMKVKSLVFQARSSLIEDQRAREIPCQEIREQLSTLTGGALRRGPIKRHLRACAGCSEFRDEVSRQRKMVAALLPVVPTVGMKEGVLAAVGIGGPGTAGGVAAGGALAGGAASSGGAASAGGVAVSTAGAGAAGGGGLLTTLGAAGAAKVAVVAVVAVGGTAAVERIGSADRGSETPTTVRHGGGKHGDGAAAGVNGRTGAKQGAKGDAAARGAAGSKGDAAKKHGHKNGKNGKGAKNGGGADPERSAPTRTNGAPPASGTSNGNGNANGHVRDPKTHGHQAAVPPSSETDDAGSVEPGDDAGTAGPPPRPAHPVHPEHPVKPPKIPRDK
jgi:RNA polymerase sigma factor (sigma-70 family)